MEDLRKVPAFSSDYCDFIYVNLGLFGTEVQEMGAGRGHPTPVSSGHCPCSSVPVYPTTVPTVSMGITLSTSLSLNFITLSTSLFLNFLSYSF